MCAPCVVTLALQDAEVGVRDVCNFLRLYKIPLYVHRNMFPGEKDFGVRMEKIDERIEKLL